jgi:hypothetical protein
MYIHTCKSAYIFCKSNRFIGGSWNSLGPWGDHLPTSPFHAYSQLVRRQETTQYLAWPNFRVVSGVPTSAVFSRQGVSVGLK